MNEMNEPSARRSLMAVAVGAPLLIVASNAVATIAPTPLPNLAREARAIAVARVNDVTLIDGLKVALATVIRPLGGVRQDQRVAFVAARTWTCDSSDAVPGETALLFLTEPRDRRWWTQLVERRRQEAAELAKLTGTPVPDALSARAGPPGKDLARLGRTPLLQLCYSGRGRMPIHRQDGAEFLVAWQRESLDRSRKSALWIGWGVELPADIRGTRAPTASDPDYYGARFLVPLAELEQYLRRFPKTLLASPAAATPSRAAVGA